MKLPTSLGPCCVQAVPDRVKTQTAPSRALSRGPPMTAVLPSAERAIAEPCRAEPTAPVPTSLAPWRLQSPPERVQTNASADVAVVRGPADDRGVAVRRKSHRRSLRGGTDRVGSDQPGLLRPGAGRACEDPRGAGRVVVERPSDDEGVAVRRDRHGRPLARRANPPRTDELAALRHELRFQRRSHEKSERDGGSREGAGVGEPFHGVTSDTMVVASQAGAAVRFLMDPGQDGSAASAAFASRVRTESRP